MKSFFFFFNDTATTEIYTLSLHDALPISSNSSGSRPGRSHLFTKVTTGTCRDRHTSNSFSVCGSRPLAESSRDRKSTRLNSSHQIISYAVFCLKKKKTDIHMPIHPTRQSV